VRGFVYQDEGSAGGQVVVGVKGQGIAGFEADAADVVGGQGSLACGNFFQPLPVAAGVNRLQAGAAGLGAATPNQLTTS